MTTGVLFVAHGSPVRAANQELLDLVDGVRARGHYGVVEPAFLEGASPDIPEGLARCVAQGADKVVVIPYFLLPGRHVSEDLPRFLAEAKALYPGTQFILGDYLRFSERMGQAVLRRIREAGMI
ncbi:CbiX protein [Tumebacillus sp. BK434]|uniref:sirohydrochlorin chelatase n=1 Tax=Tumebacillus sp. BK434 TaxID=2512169 RepID=UPI0010EC8FF9|nr:CbiX/SirB N-terminal domain-containing protein [Tumebacillus sp. BK434]TCP59476.1 CbiX protein [Tumebacillus sp. BK434]